VALEALLEARAGDAEAADAANGHQMVQTANDLGREAEHAALDADLRLRVVDRHQAVFVVEEAAAADDELAALLPQRRTRALDAARAAELEVLQQQLADRLFRAVAVAGKLPRIVVQPRILPAGEACGVFGRARGEELLRNRLH
jgi:hypothetical protein